MLEDGCQEAEIFTLHKMRHQSMAGFAVVFFFLFLLPNYISRLF